MALRSGIGRFAWVGALAWLACFAVGMAEPATPPAQPATAAGAVSMADLAAYHGKVVYLDFWASWCVPCRQSFPWMGEMQRRYGKDGLVVLAINMDQVHADAEAFLKNYPAGFTVRFDPQGQLAQHFKVRGMPTSALLGRDGGTLFVHEGFRVADHDSLERSIRDALR